MTKPGDLRLRINQPDRDSKAEQPPTAAQAAAATGFNLFDAMEANRLRNDRINRLRTAMLDAIDAGVPQSRAQSWFFQLRQNPNLICPMLLAANHDDKPCWCCDMVAAGRAEK